jgi:hypothetical protein
MVTYPFVDPFLLFLLVIIASLCVEFGVAWGIVTLQLRPLLCTIHLSALPHLSSHFLKWLVNKKSGQWGPMPCPRCGHRPVPARPGAVILGRAGLRSLVIYLIVLAILGYAVSLMLGFMVSLAICGTGLLAIALLPLLKVPLGRVYHCHSCNLAWTYSEIEKMQRHNGAQSKNNSPGPT